MSTKSVYSIRIPAQFRKMMDEMDDVNWQEEIRQLTIRLIQEESKKRLLRDAESIRKKMKDVEAAELIREDRDVH
ncbi:MULTISPECIES: hypothetical protein [Methanobacterium]|uniref:CopG family transcriptional regulator n=1 Tax=Methanobacterium subterraneum TaxID=59277 RepID=A0A2H4VDF8_9EURY|nr:MULTISPECIES: hypothetical protein [Methanobacterium]MBW4257709.1 hypothetical protein [Methanobacterium sp. YSL]PKL71455.1 MAG: hypothetical protein CVV29_10525 [Methanobacteriales archaeon HGW-Methanobacteriales-2]AUB56122.1 hypothetical protein BK007_08980 [Methanobacterium subterraneum]AUB59005.1 hypothetical protein BK008_12205 [Methanobacterium sp. MZ-A1]AUB60007.1 hypothetical protein BK009_04515 [Methanobacterium subterraneum]